MQFGIALSGLNGRGGIVTQGVALGWHVDGPLARNAGITRNAIPPRMGHRHVSLGHRPRNRNDVRTKAPKGRHNQNNDGETE